MTKMLGTFWSSLLVALLACAIPFHTIPLTSEQVPVRHTEGLMHGFLALRTLDGKRLADGEVTQVAEGDRVTSRLIFRFKDGSVYDDTTIFSQRGTFRLLNDHLVQHGPSFKQNMEASVDASSGQLTVRYKDQDGEEKILKERRDLPSDVANDVFPSVHSLNASFRVDLVTGEILTSIPPSAPPRPACHPRT